MAELELIKRIWWALRVLSLFLGQLRHMCYSVWNQCPIYRYGPTMQMSLTRYPFDIDLNQSAI